MALFSRRLTSPTTSDGEILAKAVLVAQDEKKLAFISDDQRTEVERVAKAIQNSAMGASSFGTGGVGINLGNPARPHKGLPVGASDVARRAAQSLGPSSTLTPDKIEAELKLQGLDWVEPFAPGRPLTPFYGYNRRPRQWDYVVGRNITTEPRDSRIPFTVLQQIVDGYDVAQICARHIIHDLMSMKLRFVPMEGLDDPAKKEIAAAKAFFRHPDGKRPFAQWFYAWAWDTFTVDAGALYKQRDKAGNLIGLKYMDGRTLAPMVDYFGDIPSDEAPAFVQFIMGIPWNWLRWSDIIYQPRWPLSYSPYGLPPIESVLINANTDVRLQMYFLDFFKAGNVPEAFATAPPDQSDPDSLAEWQETFDAWTMGDQAKRWGLRWLPAGTDIHPTKPTQFDPQVAEYVMRRTVAAYGLVPHDLGFTDEVNRATGDTQMDVQFRISTMPNVEYYEAIFNDILQLELGLPVEAHFDTGREKEDRLMEAQAHQLYVQMGAESPDEVREQVLSLPVNSDERVPRFFSSRTGPIPLSAIIAVAGQIDPDTGAPLPGTVAAQEYIWPGMMQPDPAGGKAGLAKPADSPPPQLNPDRVHEEGGNPNFTPMAPYGPKATSRRMDQTPRARTDASGQGYGTVAGNLRPSVTKEVESELKAFRNFVKKRAELGVWRDFHFNFVDDVTAEAANAYAREAFAKADGAGDADPKGVIAAQGALDPATD